MRFLQMEVHPGWEMPSAAFSPRDTARRDVRPMQAHDPLGRSPAPCRGLPGSTRRSGLPAGGALHSFWNRLPIPASIFSGPGKYTYQKTVQGILISLKDAEGARWFHVNSGLSRTKTAEAQNSEKKIAIKQA